MTLLFSSKCLKHALMYLTSHIHLFKKPSNNIWQTTCVTFIDDKCYSALDIHLKIYPTEDDREGNNKAAWIHGAKHSWVCSARPVICRRALSLKHCLCWRPSFPIDPPVMHSICVAADGGLWKSRPAITLRSQVISHLVTVQRSPSAATTLTAHANRFSLISLQP